MNVAHELDKGLVLKNLLSSTGIYDLIEKDDLTEIWINKPYQAYIETYTGREEIELKTLSLESLKQIANAFAVFNSTSITKANPIVNGVFPTGERAQIVIPPAVPDGTISITVRKPSRVRLNIQSYIDNGKFNNFCDVSNDIQIKKESIRNQKVTIGAGG